MSDAEPLFLLVLLSLIPLSVALVLLTPAKLVEDSDLVAIAYCLAVKLLTALYFLAAVMLAFAPIVAMATLLENSPHRPVFQTVGLLLCLGMTFVMAKYGLEFLLAPLFEYNEICVKVFACFLIILYSLIRSA